MDEMRFVNNLAQSWCIEVQLQIMPLVAAIPPSSGSSNSVIIPLLGRDEARLIRAPHSPGPGNSLREEHRMGQNGPILEEETASYPGNRTPNTHSLTWAFLCLHTNCPTENQCIVIIFMNSSEEQNIIAHFQMKVPNCYYHGHS